MLDYEGTTYRPPPEMDTPLLQVTVGCSHNKCTFCDMYQDVDFKVEDLDQVESYLKEIKYIFPKVERVFLVNGDAFVLSTGKLKTITGMIQNILPACKSISMYASIHNIIHKSETDLKALKSLGINDLYVGVETGDEATLNFINKGHTLSEAITQLDRLTRTGINHFANLMLGIAGRNNGLINAKKTADFLNQTKPKKIWIGTTSIYKNAPLSKAIKNGNFIAATEREVLEEEKELLRLIHLKDIRVYGIHPTNTIKVSGILPDDRDKMINIIDEGIQHIGETELEKTFDRSSL